MSLNQSFNSILTLSWEQRVENISKLASLFLRIKYSGIEFLQVFNYDSSCAHIIVGNSLDLISFVLNTRIFNVLINLISSIVAV